MQYRPLIDMDHSITLPASVSGLRFATALDCTARVIQWSISIRGQYYLYIK